MKVTIYYTEEVNPDNDGLNIYTFFLHNQATHPVHWQYSPSLATAGRYLREIVGLRAGQYDLMPM